MFKKYLDIALYIIFSISLRAQPSMPGLNTAERVFEAPDSVHVLTAVEKVKIEHAFAALPALHQHILKTHLNSIILHESISEWATQKENTLIESADNSENIEFCCI